MGRNLLRTVMDHRLGLAPLGRAELALGCRLIAPVHRVRPGVWHTPTKSAATLMLSACNSKPPFQASSFVPQPIWNAIRGSGAAQPLFRAMPVIAAGPDRRQGVSRRFAERHGWGSFRGLTFPLVLAPSAPCRARCEWSIRAPSTTSWTGVTAGRTSLSLTWTAKTFSRYWPRPARRPAGRFTAG